MKWKAGVIFEVAKQIAKVLPLIDAVYHRLAHREAVITSGTEGRHRDGSLHYQGLAIDLRTRDLDEDTQKKLCSALRDVIGDDYQVILERDHIHLEYDPRR